MNILADRSKEDLKRFNVHFERFIQDSDDTHVVYTPLELCDDVISKIHNENNFKFDTKVLILCNIEFIKVLQMLYNSLNINMNNVYFVSICSVKGDLAVQFGSKYIKYNSYKEFFEDNNLPKFDVVIGNPPYNSNIHLDFLEKCYDISSRFVVLIHPSMWLYAQKPGNASALKSKSDKLKNKIKNHFKSFEIFNGNKIFGIKLFGPCVITNIDKLKTETNIKIIDNINDNLITMDDVLQVNPFFTDSTIYNSIKNKIWNYCLNNNLEHNIGKHNGEFFISIPNFTGNNNEETIIDIPFYNICSDLNDTTKPKVSSRGNQWRFVSFLNESEMLYCNKYLHSDFVSFCLMIVKVNQNLHRGELKYVPFFDFSEEWQDDKIYKELNLTKKEIQYIEDNV